MRRLLFASIAACALSLCANAVPITFTLRGTATGTANGVPFTAAPFTFTFSSDTNLVIESQEGSLHFLVYPPTIVSLTIGGVGNGTFSNKFRIGTTAGQPFVGISDINGGSAYYEIGYAGMVVYPFAAAFGPVSVTALVGGVQSSPSSLGDITFSSVSNLAYGAITPPAPATTPIPSSLVLALTGFGGAVLWYRRQIRRLSG